ncbi:hypothetical protein [Pseudonocardia spirodelae]|uniref:Uncharacterized protein n=1 Tax=Pseudonocardia spirodelae TaxID=3133431 RepID=A0ABU8T8T2_9PSEU
MSAFDGNKSGTEGNSRTVNNTADGNAKVDTQIGIVHGDANFYTVDDDADPSEKFEKGVNFLDGSMPRRAEEVIEEAFTEGFRSSRVCYYWIMALFSDRSLDLLTEDVLDRLALATEQAEQYAEDEWTLAIGVTTGLVRRIAELEGCTDVAYHAVDDSIQQFDSLTLARKKEARRHLERILSGVMQDRLEAMDRERVDAARMENGRRRRAKLFFHPVPTPPVRSEAPSDLSAVPMLIVAGPLASATIYLLGLTLLSSSIEVVLIVMVGVTLAGAGSVRYVAYNFPRLIESAEASRTRDRYSGRIARDWSHHHGPSRPKAGVFARQVGHIIDWSFFNEAIVRDVDTSKWLRDSKGIRRTLACELTERFCHRAIIPQPRSVEWLANLHASRQLAAWRLDGFPTIDRPAESTSSGDVMKSAIGPTLMIIGAVAPIVVLRAAASSQSAAGMFAVAVTASASVLILRSAAERITVGRRVRKALDRRYEFESESYLGWVEKLKERPTDSEMSAWLGHDKLYIKSAAMRQYGLSNSDLLDHFFILGAADGARSARIAHGPPRYTTYEVWLFLLTSAGVRRVLVELDLVTGDLNNESRMSFRYDSITSAFLDQHGVAPGAGDDQEESDHSDILKAIRSVKGKLVLHQVFVLSLNNDDSLQLVLANFDESLWDKVQEEPSRIAQLTRDASGADSALRILEAVAAEGSAWVEEEKARRRRRTLNYTGRPRTPRLLTTTSTDGGLVPVA